MISSKWHLKLFQKGSPFLEDLDYLIDTSSAIGLSVDEVTRYYLPNSTKCTTWQDVRASHMKKDHEVIVNLDDTFGLMILLASGLGGALAILIVELLTKAKKPK